MVLGCENLLTADNQQESPQAREPESNRQLQLRLAAESQREVQQLIEQIRGEIKSLPADVKPLAYFCFRMIERFFQAAFAGIGPVWHEDNRVESHATASFKLLQCQLGNLKELRNLIANYEESSETTRHAPEHIDGSGI